ncbi:MAG: M48 family metallopeptidase [Candidatus Susulua stagnicola]|nr:M48 family metallopeptidase [Candidatus Susulua stagnicola]
MKYVHKKISENVNISKHHPLKYLFSRLFVLIVVICVVYFALSGALEIAIKCIPEKLEAALSTSLAPSFVGLVDDTNSASQKRLETILSELITYYPGKNKKFKIYLTEQDEVNAFALPGNTIIVLSGLLEELDNDKELAFVIGHELGHYFHRDHLRGLGQGAIFMAIMASLGGGDPGGVVSKSINLFGLHYSRKQENAADLFSLNLLKKSYGSSQGAISAIEKLGIYGEKEGYQAFSTHPLIKQRVRVLREHSFN